MAEREASEHSGSDYLSCVQRDRQARSQAALIEELQLHRQLLSQALFSLRAVEPVALRALGTVEERREKSLPMGDLIALDSLEHTVKCIERVGIQATPPDVEALAEAPIAAPGSSTFNLNTRETALETENIRLKSELAAAREEIAKFRPIQESPDSGGPLSATAELGSCISCGCTASEARPSGWILVDDPKFLCPRCLDGHERESS